MWISWLKTFYAADMSKYETPPLPTTKITGPVENLDMGPSIKQTYKTEKDFTICWMFHCCYLPIRTLSQNLLQIRLWYHLIDLCTVYNYTTGKCSQSHQRPSCPLYRLWSLYITCLLLWYKNCFHITSPLWRESTGNRWFAAQRDEWEAIIHPCLNFNGGLTTLALVIGQLWGPGPWFSIKMSSYQYSKYHCGDKTILRLSYLHIWISILVRRHLCIESAPWSWWTSYSKNQFIHMSSKNTWCLPPVT